MGFVRARHTATGRRFAAGDKEVRWSMTGSRYAACVGRQGSHEMAEEARAFEVTLAGFARISLGARH